MEKIKLTKKEKDVIFYARDFLYNAYLAHQNDSLGKAIKKELKKINCLCKKLERVGAILKQSNEKTLKIYETK